MGSLGERGRQRRWEEGWGASGQLLTGRGRGEGHGLAAATEKVTRGKMYEKKKAIWYWRLTPRPGQDDRMLPNLPGKVNLRGASRGGEGDGSGSM